MFFFSTKLIVYMYVLLTDLVHLRTFLLLRISHIVQIKEIVLIGTKKKNCLLSVLTGVCIQRVNFRENVWTDV